MKIKRKARGNAELDVSAFSDIAFLLIIFFILTTTFVKPFGHRLRIPSGTSDQSEKRDTQLTLVLRKGRILYGEKAEDISLDELRARLARERFAEKAEGDRLVIVESADDVPYDHYFQVVMAITHAGGVLALLEEEEGEGS
jgi:biopolymer transport protein ExbD